MSWTPPPGSIGLTYSYGWVGIRATLGHLLAGENARYSHAFIVIDPYTIVEPWPDGVRIAALADYHGDYVAYGWLVDITDAQRQAIVTNALACDGVGHGMADYLALAAYRIGLRTRRIVRRVQDPRRLLPIQFIAEVYWRAGLELLPGADPATITLCQLADELLVGPRWRLHVPTTPPWTPEGRVRWGG